MVALALAPGPSEVFGSQTSGSRDPRQHAWTDLLAVVKRKDDIGPAITRKHFMRTSLALDPPTNAQEGAENDLRLSSTPNAHAATVKT